MAKYIFTFDQQDNTFPERYRVVSTADDAQFLRDTEGLTGTVLDTEALTFLEDLMARCAASESLICEFVDAPYWRFIELRFNPAEAERRQNGGDEMANSDGSV